MPERGRLPVIDGLRALAILLVLGFHAAGEWISGGFAGVDVFFVLSGYLITRLVIDAIHKNEFCYSHYLLRRLCRIWPALLVTVSGVALAAPFFLAPYRLDHLPFEIRSALLFFANHYYLQGTNYFQPAAETQPLLHTWSVAVEMQFYLIWPLILKMFIRWMLPLTLLVAFASLTVSTVAFDAYPEASFYLMPLRLFAFSLGAAVASTQFTVNLISPNLATICGLFLLAVLGAGFFGQDYEPLASGLAAALATSLILYGAKGELAHQIIAFKMFCIIGRRAFSLYLVHWPIFVFARLNGDLRLEPIEIGALLVLTAVLSELLYRLIETPFRMRNQTLERNHSFALMALTFVAALILSTAHRLPQKERQILISDNNSVAHAAAYSVGICHLRENNKLDLYEHDACTPPDDHRPRYLVFGDSTAADNIMILRAAYPEIGFGQFTFGACPTTPPHLHTPRPARFDCSARASKAYAIAAGGDYDGIVISLHAALWPPVQVALILEWADTHNLRTVVLGQKPRFHSDIRDILHIAASPDQARKIATNLVAEYPKRANATVLDVLQSSVQVARLYPLACTPLCEVLTPDNHSIYLDHHHLTWEGALWYAKRLRNSYPDLFKLH